MDKKYKENNGCAGICCKGCGRMDAPLNTFDWLADVPGNEEYLKELKNETDKLILGQHFVYDNQNKLKIIGWGITQDSDFITYANYIKMAMEKNIPNIIAHPDLFMLNNDSFGEIEKKATEIICEAASKYQIPLEINLTRASMYLDKRIDRIDYPNKSFWEIASKYDLKVVYGVDAHAKYQIDFYEESIELVNKILGKDIIDKLSFCENL